MTLEKLLDYFRLGPRGVRRFETFLKVCGDCEYSNYRSACYGLLSCEYSKVNKESIVSGNILVCPKFKRYDYRHFTLPPSGKDDSSGSGGDDIPDYDNYTSGHIGPTGGRM